MTLLLLTTIQDVFVFSFTVGITNRSARYFRIPCVAGAAGVTILTLLGEVEGTTGVSTLIFGTTSSSSSSCCFISASIVGINLFLSIASGL